MTARDIIRGWNTFFFAPQSPTPIALYRVFYGALNVVNLLMLRRDWLTWYGTHGFVTLATIDRVRPLRISPAIWPDFGLFPLLPHTDAAVVAFYWMFLAFAICLTIGFMSRLSSIVVYVCFMSLYARNPFITNGGDQLLHLAGFFLMFAPAGAALSVDRLLRVWRGVEGPTIAPRAPWAQRMIQIQISIMYVSTVWWKTMGTTWLDGTAIYYARQSIQFRRFPVPGLTNLLMVRLATWSALCIEGAGGTLIWLRDLRYPVLLALLALHVGLEYALNIPLFQWIVLTTLVTFVYPEDFTRALEWVRRRLGPHLRQPIVLVYDATSARSVQRAAVLQIVDLFGGLRFVQLQSANAPAISPGMAASAARGPVVVLSDSTVRSGFALLRTIAPRIPLLWPLAPLSLVTPHPQFAAHAPIGR